MAYFTEVIPPGQTGEIKFEITGSKVSGTFTKTATVFSNDPSRKAMKISVHAQVIQYVDVVPSSKVYLRGTYDQSVSKILTIRSNETDREFEITGIRSNIDDKITYKLGERSAEGEYELTIWKNPKLPTMNTWGSVYLDTNSENDPEKVIEVNVTTRGSIVVHPSTVNFGRVIIQNAEQEPIERVVTVYKISGSFQIENVQFSSDFYEASIESLEEGKRYRVTVRIRPGTKDSYIDEMIINTNDPQEPTVKVRLLARGV
ncbi:MAG: hypothetical protein O7D32_03285 [bacterium]|nr:hypothetical protein [bacterium]